MTISSAQDVTRLGRILGVWAHPDDETFTSAGIMSVAITNNQEVMCVTATKGEQGVQNESKWPKARLASIRKAELETAFNILGVSNHVWLEYKDGHCREDDDSAIKEISKIINEFKPDSILTFGKDGITGHSDHRAVSCWVTQALQAVKSKPTTYHAAHTNKQYTDYLGTLDQKLNIFFNVDEPYFYDEKDCHICFKLDKNLSKKKYQALEAMPSQTEVLRSTFSEEFICLAFSTEVFVVAK